MFLHTNPWKFFGGHPPGPGCCSFPICFPQWEQQKVENAISKLHGDHSTNWNFCVLLRPWSSIYEREIVAPFFWPDLARHSFRILYTSLEPGLNSLWIQGHKILLCLVRYGWPHISIIKELCPQVYHYECSWALSWTNYHPRPTSCQHQCWMLSQERLLFDGIVKMVTHLFDSTRLLKGSTLHQP